MYKTIGLLTILLAAVLLLNQCNPTGPSQPKQPTYIAHGCGGYQGESVTNSLEALTHNYKIGHRFFEVDLCWTSDRHLVLIHDWLHSYRRFFYYEDNLRLMSQYLTEEELAMLGEEPMKTLRKALLGNPDLPKPDSFQPPLEIFLSLSMFSNFTQLSFDQLAEWLARHPDAYIVTDIKEEDNVAALAYIKNSANQYDVRLGQIIPQVYKFSEYSEARDLGYQEIILTNYRAAYSDQEILEFSKKHSLFAVTLPYQNILVTELGNRLSEANVFVYVHTVNDTRLIGRLKDRGVRGFYTDWLVEKPGT